MKTGIIIPCYNEEKRLNVSAFINFIKKENNYHLCFVNDGSKDDTMTVLKKIQSGNSLKVSIIDIKKFEDFDGLLKTLKTNTKLSMVFGSRAKEGGDSIEKDTLRAFFSKIIKMLVFFILRLPIEDTQCGAKVFKASLVPVLFEKNFFSRWLFDVEMFLRMKKHFGKVVILNKIYEQPLKRWIHMEDSKLGIKDSLEIPYRLLTIWFNYNVLQNLSYQVAKHDIEPTIEIYGRPSQALLA